MDTAVKEGYVDEGTRVDLFKNDLVMASKEGSGLSDVTLDNMPPASTPSALATTLFPQATMQHSPFPPLAFTLPLVMTQAKPARKSPVRAALTAPTTRL